MESWTWRVAVSSCQILRGTYRSVNKDDGFTPLNDLLEQIPISENNSR
jgi:hypothetical protein